jgi:hypothetical protein
MSKITAKSTGKKYEADTIPSSFVLRVTEAFRLRIEELSEESATQQSNLPSLTSMLHHLLRNTTCFETARTPHNVSSFDILFPMLLSNPTPSNSAQHECEGRESAILRSVVDNLDVREFDRLVLGAFKSVEKRLLSTCQSSAVYASLYLLSSMFGPLTSDNESLWDVAISALQRSLFSWSVEFAEVIARWVAVKKSSCALFLRLWVDIWANELKVKCRTDDQHLCMFSRISILGPPRSTRLTFFCFR